MPEVVTCISAFLVVAAVVLFFGYLLKNSTSSKRGVVMEGLAEYRRARTFGERLVVFFWYSALFFFGGLAGILIALTGLLVSAGSAVCGVNPWPYIVEMFHRVVDALHGTAEQEAT